MNRSYLRLGDFEIANNLRVTDYAANVGANWYMGCDACEALRVVLYADDGSPVYRSVKDDPAPWYDEDNLDSTSFLGVAMLDAQGDSDSLREGEVVERLRYGSVTGAPYTRGRELTFRLLVVATDEPGLDFGLAWLRSMDDTDGTDACYGVDLNFYSACSPICAHTEDEAEECLKACVLPYAHHFKEVRIAEGIQVINRQELPSGGYYAEVELILQANDPQEYTTPVAVGDFEVVGGEPMTDTAPEPEPVDPFAPPQGWTPMRPQVDRPVPSDWYRTTWDLPVRENVVKALDGLAPEISVTSENGCREVRLTLMQGRMAVGSWVIPRIPAGGTVRLQPARAGVYTAHSGVTLPRPGYVYAPTGGPAAWPPLAYDDYVLAVDQAFPGALDVSVTAGTVG